MLFRTLATLLYICTTVQATPPQINFPFIVLHDDEKDKIKNHSDANCQGMIFDSVDPQCHVTLSLGPDWFFSLESSRQVKVLFDFRACSE